MSSTTPVFSNVQGEIMRSYPAARAHWPTFTRENRILFYDSKTVLQEIIQTKPNQKLVYVLVDEIGPDHNKEFVVEALLNDKKIGFGQGKTKKAAEQKAAYEAILYLRKNQD